MGIWGFFSLTSPPGGGRDDILLYHFSFTATDPTQRKAVQVKEKKKDGGFKTAPDGRLIISDDMFDDDEADDETKPSGDIDSDTDDTGECFKYYSILNKTSFKIRPSFLKHRVWLQLEQSRWLNTLFSMLCVIDFSRGFTFDYEAVSMVMGRLSSGTWQLEGQIDTPYPDNYPYPTFCGVTIVTHTVIENIVCWEKYNDEVVIRVEGHDCLQADNFCTDTKCQDA